MGGHLTNTLINAGILNLGLANDGEVGQGGQSENYADSEFRDTYPEDLLQRDESMSNSDLILQQ